MKRIYLSFLATLFFLGCGGGGGSTASDSPDYIPKQLDDAVAYRFLNKATFGATPEDVARLKKIGVSAWLDEQLNMPATDRPYLRTLITTAINYAPNENNYTLEEYMDLDNDIVFNQGIGSFNTQKYFLGAWFENAVHAKDQLRHKTAYALSQIVVESDSNGAFLRRTEALADYYDILYKNAFNSYEKLLDDISFSPGMGVYLTYVGNKKPYVDGNTTILPDENYAREIMQLFSLGVNLLNIDGTPVVKDGRYVQTYTQKDIMELSRVFTGWTLKDSGWFGRIAQDGAYYYPLVSVDKYHDFDEKTVLGEVIPADLSPEDDIKYAVHIICSHPNAAPYISKKLIMRLTKSNPSKEYVKRVALVFKNSGGNLRKVVKAIFTDPEFWDDLKSGKWEKFKEPQIAYTQFMRAFKAKTFPFHYHCYDDNLTDCIEVYNAPWVTAAIKDTLNQGPGMADTVFGFYSDDYIPNSEYFVSNGLHAPEIQIQTDTQIINFNNKIADNLYIEKNYMLSKTYDLNGTQVQFSSMEELAQNAREIGGAGARFIYKWYDKYYYDLSDEFNVLEKAIDGDTDGDFENLVDCSENNQSRAIKALIEYENVKLTGGIMSQEEKDLIYKYVGECIYKTSTTKSKKQYIYETVIRPLVRYIVGSEKYMRE